MVCDKFSFKGEVEGCERCSVVIQELCEIGREMRLQGSVIEQEGGQVQEEGKGRRYEIRPGIVDSVDVEELRGLSKSEVIRRLLKKGLRNKEIVRVMQGLYPEDGEDRLYNLVRYVKVQWKRSGFREMVSKQRVRVRDDVVSGVNVEELKGLSKSEVARRLLNQGLHPKEVAIVMQKLYGGDVLSLYRTVKWVQYYEKKKGSGEVEWKKGRRLEVREDVVNGIDVDELMGKSKTRMIVELLDRGLNVREVAMVLMRVFPGDGFEKLYRLVRATKSVEKRKKEGKLERKKSKEKDDERLIKERIRGYVMQGNVVLVSDLVGKVSEEFGLERGRAFQLIEEVYEELEKGV